MEKLITIETLMEVEDKINSFTEDQLQAYIFKVFNNRFTDFRRQLFAVPNGGNRDGREANKLKATGVIPGIPDLIFFSERNLIFFELKVGKNKLSSNQLVQKLVINNKNRPYFLVRTPDQFFFGLICKLMERKELTTEQATELFKALQDSEDLVFFGLTEEDFKFEVRVFTYLFEMEEEKQMDIVKLTREETRGKFIKTIKKFIHLEFDRSNNFQITFNQEFTKFVKQSLL